MSVSVQTRALPLWSRPERSATEVTRVVGPLEAASFEVHPEPQFVFDEEVQVVAQNRAARELVERAQGPRAVAELLVKRTNGAAQTAYEAIARAIRTQLPSDEIELVAPPHLAFALRAIPLAPPHRCALVTLRALETRGARSARERYALTPMEERVADLLCRGMTPARIAASLGISVETVRCHLKQAFAKTGAHRQAELVALLLGA